MLINEIAKRDTHFEISDLETCFLGYHSLVMSCWRLLITLPKNAHMYYLWSRRNGNKHCFKDGHVREGHDRYGYGEVGIQGATLLHFWVQSPCDQLRFFKPKLFFPQLCHDTGQMDQHCDVQQTCALPFTSLPIREDSHVGRIGAPWLSASLIHWVPCVAQGPF